MPTTEEKVRDFFAELDEIYLRNSDYFILERPALPNGERDKLTNHYKFEMQNGRAMFGFVEGSNLPYKIRKKCLAKFQAYFPDGGIVGRLFER